MNQKKNSLIILFLLLVGLLTAQEKNITQLEKLFKNPPRKHKIYMNIHERLDYEPEFYNEIIQRNLGGVVLNTGGKGDQDVTIKQPVDELKEGERNFAHPDYLSHKEGFMKTLKDIQWLKENGLGVWLYDELGYPSGSAGGKVIQGNPEFQPEIISCTFKKEITGPEKITVSAQLGDVFACYAIPVNNDSPDLDRQVHLASKLTGNTLNWEVPEGKWLVLYLEKHYSDTWKRHGVYRENVNLLNADATRKFIQVTHQQYANYFGDALGKNVDAVFTDEPQLSSAEPWGKLAKTETYSAVPYVAELPARFLKDKGYQLETALPAIYIDSEKVGMKYRYDFYDVVTDLIAENYYGEIQQWCQNHGIASAGHMVLEESLILHILFSGSMIKNWQKMDIPGIDFLGCVESIAFELDGWKQPADRDFMNKLVSSVAHLTGKQCFSESYGFANHLCHTKEFLSHAKSLAAWQYAGGIDLINTYTIGSVLTTEEHAELSEYTGRLDFLSTMGIEATETALLIPETSIWATNNLPEGGRFNSYFENNDEAVRIDENFRKLSNEFIYQQREFLYLWEDILNEAEIVDGRLNINEFQFKALVIPDFIMLKKQTLETIEKFADGGGVVVWTGALPQATAEEGHLPDLTEKLKKKIASVSNMIYFPADDSYGPVFKYLDKKVPVPYKWNGDSRLRVQHKQDGDRTIFLLVNPTNDDFTGELQIHSEGKFYTFDPETGESSRLNTTIRNGNNFISQDLPAYSSRFVIVDNL
ncbi:MAG: glycosyl hydrolase [Prolixibacteraceae bacterium]